MPVHLHFVKSLIQTTLSFADMLAATSVLQQQAAEIRQQRVNWQSYQTYVFQATAVVAGSGFYQKN
jgi:hypothetical protein